MVSFIFLEPNADVIEYYIFLYNIVDFIAINQNNIYIYYTACDHKFLYINNIFHT